MHPLPLVSLFALATVCPAQWIAESPATSPSPRSGAAIAFDATRGVTTLVGGALTSPVVFADTWTYDGSEWQLQNPPLSPSARSGTAMVYDQNRGVCVLFGGTSVSLVGGASFQDTWEWNGTTWTQRVTATTPFRTGRHGMAFDSARGRTVAFGGVPSTLLIGASNQTWEYDGVNWIQRPAATNPGALDGPAMCYSQALSACVLFGGVTPITGAMNSTTWLWNGTAWTQASIVGTPPPARYQASMCYDASRAVCVMHGGVTAAGTMLDDTWEFDGSSWTQVVTSSPGARRMASMAYDALRSTPLLYGGINAITGGPISVLGDTWTYGAMVFSFGLGCQGSVGTPQLLAASGPRLGQTYAPVLTNLVPTMPIALVALGFSNTTWSGVPLPLDLTSSGMPNCSLLVAADQIDVIAAQNGQGTLLLAIPGDPWFLGQTFFQQGFSFEVPGYNAFGGVLSNALRVRIGQ
jgi:hypothetical protein